MVYYLETSAFLSMLFSEPNSKIVREKLEQAKTIVTSIITILETKRALVRAQAMNSITSGEMQILFGVLEKHKQTWNILGITEAIENNISFKFPVEPIRTLDAIHLASALELKQAFPTLQVLSLDQRIIENMTALGLE